MRNIIDIVSENMLSQPTEPEYGAGEVITPENAPTVLYHGTNFISAAAILAQGKFEAEEPVDDDDLGPVVCLTSDETMGRNFAIEFVRINSDHPVGAVFALDGAKVADYNETFPYHAETAGVFEYEFRSTGDIPVEGFVKGVKLVGEVGLLNQERFLETSWEEMPHHMKGWFGSAGKFWQAVESLMTAAGQPRVPELDDDDYEDED